VLLRECTVYDSVYFLYTKLRTNVCCDVFTGKQLMLTRGSLVKSFTNKTHFGEWSTQLVCTRNEVWKFSGLKCATWLMRSYAGFQPWTVTCIVCTNGRRYFIICGPAVLSTLFIVCSITTYVHCVKTAAAVQHSWVSSIIIVFFCESFANRWLEFAFRCVVVCYTVCNWRYLYPHRTLWRYTNAVLLLLLL